jgi:hypothetical protein
MGVEGLLDTLRRTLPALQDSGAAYAVVGGVAAAVHGLFRPTRDVEALVHERDLERATQALRRTRLRHATEVAGPSIVFSNDDAGCAIELHVARVEPERGFSERGVLRRVFGAPGRVATLEQLLVLAHLHFDPDRRWDDLPAIVRSRRVDVAEARRVLVATRPERFTDFDARVRAALVPRGARRPRP